MNIVAATARKQRGEPLSADEIRTLVADYMAGQIDDDAMAGLLRAICQLGLDLGEAAALADAMADSGRRLDLSTLPGIKVDKHSTGGVGDKVTLVACPLAAAAGVPVAKLSGRALGHTGGTIDKLESIPGLRTALSEYEFVAQVADIGLAIASQSDDLAPADRRLYALRDRTGTVASAPLIAASVMSKKLAAGADAIVLDVKHGAGAFMHTLEEAEHLAGLMMHIGEGAGRAMSCLLSPMDQPLGRAVGNALEVWEAAEMLRGEGPADLREASLVVAGLMIHAGGQAGSARAGQERAADMMASGAGLERLRAMVMRQGGDPEALDQRARLPIAPHRVVVAAPRSGCVRRLDALVVGEAVSWLGAGRAGARADVEHAVGVVLHAKVGDEVAAGQPLCTVHANDEGRGEQAAGRVLGAYAIGARPADPPITGTRH
jgi:pyrimidine-nucleoside phosphorylase